MIHVEILHPPRHCVYVNSLAHDHVARGTLFDEFNVLQSLLISEIVRVI